MKMKNTLIITAGLMLAIAFISCNKDKDNKPTPPVTGTKEIVVNFSNTAPFTFFSFKDSSIVLNTDSTSSKWDFGIRRSTFLVNSNSSGPGSGGVIIQNGLFNDISTAPINGYAYDTTTSQRAIKDVNGIWYNYNSLTHNFDPIAGKVFVFKTSDGAHYAKMELLTVEYVPFAGQVPNQLTYKFRFSYQGDGSVNF